MEHCAATAYNINAHVYFGGVYCDTVTVVFGGFFNFPREYDFDPRRAGDEAFLKALGRLLVEDDGHDRYRDDQGHPDYH